MDLGLKGLKAILVGANGGIGRKVAHVLAAEGCDVALCGRTQDKVDKVLGEISPKGGKTHGEALDVTDPAAVPAFVERAAETLGGCDIFIHFTSANTGEDSDAGWQAVLDGDILPLRRGIAAAKPHLAQLEQWFRHLHELDRGVEGIHGRPSYNALKAAVIVYSSNLAQSLAKDGVRVNCITPGPVMTDDGPWAKIEQGMPDFFKGTIAKMPIGRMATGEELANAIVFVASPACKAMTGANLVIDGGYTKRVQF